MLPSFLPLRVFFLLLSVAPYSRSPYLDIRLFPYPSPPFHLPFPFLLCFFTDSSGCSNISSPLKMVSTPQIQTFSFSSLPRLAPGWNILPVFLPSLTFVNVFGVKFFQVTHQNYLTSRFISHSVGLRESESCTETPLIIQKRLFAYLGSFPLPSFTFLLLAKPDCIIHIHTQVLSSSLKTTLFFLNPFHFHLWIYLSPELSFSSSLNQKFTFRSSLPL